ncbi:antA/AntB antirepressor family protein [Enterococcus cecorum]|nr:antA/AntB antirepressor family protein [Enterococcus cecorum]MDZ5578625.1 antA/AntB antirepressor family protein [Enterococcus cecorum]
MNMELIKITTSENGEQLVSGRELHEFLEVGTKYTQWFDEMTKYGFVENVDYSTLNELSEKKEGSRFVKRTIINHAMTLDMAKEISMIQRTEKGKQARLYFIEVEKQYKFDTSSLSPELQFMNSVVQSLAKQEMATKQLSNKLDNITEIVALNTTDWRKDCRALINKMAKTQGGFGAYQEIQAAIYEEVDRRAGSSLNTRLTNLRRRAAEEGVSKSKRDKMNKLDVIEMDKRLKEIYLAVVKDFAIRYGVWKG